MVPTSQPSISEKPKLSRKCKGIHLLPVLRRLLSSCNNWFTICETKHHHYRGVFHCPSPQHLGCTEDITKLPFYSPEDEHFLFSDIQLSKAKPREPRCITFCMNYRIAPCGGVKICSAKGCSYVPSTREHRRCSEHPNQPLEHSGTCPVEFVYVRPTNSENKRRWLSGLVRSGDLSSMNLHNYPLNGASKIVVHDICNRLDEDPSLKTHDIVTGNVYMYTCVKHQPPLIAHVFCRKRNALLTFSS